ncbi:MAG: KaiC domain-containing protein [Halobacteriaceae archaeon]
MADEDSAEEELFGEDFASALDGAGAPGGGGAAGDGGSDEPFETTQGDGDFESAVPRVQVGIEGLDNMIEGGVPDRSLVTTIGSAGTGKTTFGLQFLERGLAAGERAVYLSLEERRDDILTTAEEKGWPFREYAAEGDLAVVDFDPVEMANSLTSIGDELPALIDEFGATRVVLDSVSLLEMMYEDQATRRMEVYDFSRALKRAGVTTVLTSEADSANPFRSRYGIIEHLTDAVFLLRYLRSEDFRETRLVVEIQKIRNANHSRETKPYEITDEGISVYRQANLF